MTRFWSPTKSSYGSFARLSPSLRGVQSDISGLSHYSVRETNTGGVWIDGRTIWRKVLDVGPLPNASTRLTPHGISTFHSVIKIYGSAIITSAAPHIHLLLPTPAGAGVTSGVAIEVRGDDLFIDPGSVDYSVATEAYVVLEYTK